MRSRLIAVILVASLASGVMLASLPVAQMPAMPSTAAPSQAMDHSCCPKEHLRVSSAIPLTMAQGAMPCGAEHPCCAQPAPENPPSLPAVSRRALSDPGGAVTRMIATQNLPSGSSAAEQRGCSPFQSYSVRSTVLRI